MTSLKKEAGQELKQKIEDELIYTVCVLDIPDTKKGTITVTDIPPFRPKWMRVRQITYNAPAIDADTLIYVLGCDATQSQFIGHFTAGSSVCPQSLFKVRSVGSSITFSVMNMAAGAIVPTSGFVIPVGITVEFIG